MNAVNVEDLLDLIESMKSKEELSDDFIITNSEVGSENWTVS